MTKESKLQVKKCDAGLKQKSGPVGVWSNYPVPPWSMRPQCLGVAVEPSWMSAEYRFTIKRHVPHFQS
jgi:hypothetical protein